MLGHSATQLNLYTSCAVSTAATNYKFLPYRDLSVLGLRLPRPNMLPKMKKLINLYRAVEG